MTTTRRPGTGLPPDGHRRSVSRRRFRGCPVGTGPEALRREGRAGLPFPEPDQAPGGLPEPRVLQEAGLRLSTALTPRVIACAEELPEHVALPRGCRDELEHCSAGARRPAVGGGPAPGEASRSNVTIQGGLTPVQKQAVRALLARRHRRLRRTPGVGKTVVGTYSSRPEPGARSSWSTASRSWISGSPSCPCFSASIRRRSARSGPASAARRSAGRGDDPEPRPRGARRRRRRDLRPGDRR